MLNFLYISLHFSLNHHLNKAYYSHECILLSKCMIAYWNLHTIYSPSTSTICIIKPTHLRHPYHLTPHHMRPPNLCPSLTWATCIIGTTSSPHWCILIDSFTLTWDFHTICPPTNWAIYIIRPKIPPPYSSIPRSSPPPKDYYIIYQVHSTYISCWRGIPCYTTRCMVT